MNGDVLTDMCYERVLRGRTCGSGAAATIATTARTIEVSLGRDALRGRAAIPGR